MFLHIIIGICVILAFIGSFKFVKFLYGVGTSEEEKNEWDNIFLITLGLVALSFLSAFLWCM